MSVRNGGEVSWARLVNPRLVQPHNNNILLVWTRCQCSWPETLSHKAVGASEQWAMPD